MLYFNREQLDIIQCDTNTNLKIIAGAGSGKTTTILHRIKYLLDNKIKPSNILLLTFNVSACQNMKSKLERICNTDLINSVNNTNKNKKKYNISYICIKTIDGFACKYYNKYLKKDYIVAISEYSTELLKYLRTTEGKKILNTYKYVFFDEFQDINKVQYDILLEFYKNGSKITVIGDDNQNIYKFRGSSSNFISKIDKLDIKKFSLRTNYRSTLDIISFANLLINNNCNSTQNKTQNNNSQNNSLQMEAFNNSKHKKPVLVYCKGYGDCISKIKELLEYGETDIAVLARLNNQIKNFEVELEKNAISYQTITNINDKIKANSVILSTMHKSKGLEWNTVFIIDYDEEIVKLGSMDEELKLFYVAVTRAKKELYIYFSKTKNSFIENVPNDLYEFTSNNYQNSYMVTTFYNYSILLHKIVKKLRDKEILYIRENSILPNINMLKCSLYDKVDYPDIIDKEFYNTFLSLFIERSLTSKFYKNSSTLALLNPCILDENEYIVYRKYYNFFKQNLHLYNQTESLSCDFLLKPLKTTKNIVVVTKHKDDNNKLLTILQKIKQVQNDTKIFITQIIVTCLNFLDNRLKEQSVLDTIKESYKVFTDKKKIAKNITNDIYNIALANMIYLGFRKYVYSNKYTVFYSNLKQVYKQINIFTNYFKNLDTVTDVYIYKPNILGHVNILNKSYSELVIIRYCNGVNFYDIVELYVNATMYKNIKNISIYFPYDGTFCTVELGSVCGNDHGTVSSTVSNGIVKYLNSINCY